MARIADLSFTRIHVDLASGDTRRGTIACEDLEDLLGGIGRGFKLLAERPVEDAYAPEAALVMNLGLLSGTEFMTGLRTFFHAYSPLKGSRAGRPAAMWSAGSGKLGVHLRGLGAEEVVFTGRAQRPVLLHLTEGPGLELIDAAFLVGRTVHGKVTALHERWPEAHFAVIGPAGEHYDSVRYAAIALSTVNQLTSGDPKPRFCGRGGIGGVMGSKNLLAIVADAPPRRSRGPISARLKQLNLEVARGEGSRRFRDRDHFGGGGGTWANCEALGPAHAVPEYNFVPTGTDFAWRLHRPAVETGPWIVEDEACFRCGIKCHKNLYDEAGEDTRGRFRAKLDYEPLVLLSSNIGIFDVAAISDLIVQTDELGLDAISLGVTLAYVMEYNKRHPDTPLAGGLAYGDLGRVHSTIESIGRGKLPRLGQGTKRLAEELGETGYAMHSKGVEYPAYLPQTNPGYPFALAGGHMSMRTYLLLLLERETGLDHWVEAITGRGPGIMRDDLLGICKFAGMSDERMAEAVEELSGVTVTPEEIRRAVMRTYLRGYRIEKRQGFAAADYDMPEEVHRACPQIDLPHFNTREFFSELKQRVLARFDAMLEEEGI